MSKQRSERYVVLSKKKVSPPFLATFASHRHPLPCSLISLSPRLLLVMPFQISRWFLAARFFFSCDLFFFLLFWLRSGQSMQNCHVRTFLRRGSNRGKEKGKVRTSFFFCQTRDASFCITAIVNQGAFGSNDCASFCNTRITGIQWVE